MGKVSQDNLNGSCCLIGVSGSDSRSSFELGELNLGFLRVIEEVLRGVLKDAQVIVVESLHIFESTLKSLRVTSSEVTVHEAC